MANCVEIKLIGLSDKALLALSKKAVLSLSLVEMKTVQQYFKKLKRNPTDIELETIAQTWSEHCKHKTLTGIIEYKETVGGSEPGVHSKSKTKAKIKTKVYNNLLKETVFRATKELDLPWCISVFKDNAGVIEFDETNGIAFKVETHNHPSALEPYGGAATGIGGVIRDILGVGLGAKPLANTDIFCFGDPNLPWKKLPKGMLHPKRIAKGVVSGVRDYGNRMGIPTVNGAVYFDDAYTSNPLVYCGTMGIIPKTMAFKEVKPGDLVLVAGGRTGRDGIHGATFSSVKLDKETDVSAVQIGNPIVEKKVMDTMLQARDLGLYRAVTDCGAGGLSSAVGELGEGTGVRVNLEKVSLKYEGLTPWEIWVSEAQERMVFAVPREHKYRILEIFAAENVDAAFIGEFTSDHKLTVMYGTDIIASLDMEFLHNGVPKVKNLAVWSASVGETAKAPARADYGGDLKALLGSLSICSREWIIRQYDHEVQGQTIVKPLQGPALTEQGPGDAAVIWPYTIADSVERIADSKDEKRKYKGIVLSNGMNPEYGKIDAYWMAASAIDEALRNAVCAGADIERIAILDNFCWGNPYRPEVLGSLVRAAEACYDMAIIYKTPFISGKDSLHNEYAINGKHYSIPGSLLISAVGIIKDVRKAVTMYLKEEGNLVYIVGETKNELGGSAYCKKLGIKGGSVPKVDAASSLRSMKALGSAIEAGLVRSAHDCSEGGLAVAAAEMAFAGHKGLAIDLAKVRAGHENMTDSELLFSESNSRFVIEVRPKDAKAFEKIMEGNALSQAGSVSAKGTVEFKGLGGKTIIKEDTDSLYKAWADTLKW